MASLIFLLVDDEIEFIETLGERLRQRDYDVRIAHSGTGALQAIEADHAIDVVIMDLGMPAPDGLRTLRQIKKDHPLIEVIMLTGKNTIVAAVESLKAGAYDFLTKPCEIDELVVKAEEAATRKREREAAILEIRMIPYISDQKRAELIAGVMRIHHRDE